MPPQQTYNERRFRVDLIKNSPFFVIDHVVNHIVNHLVDYVVDHIEETHKIF